jgi:uncharacterized protein
MIGIIVQLALSWLIIWFFEKGDLRFLGFYPSKKRLQDFALFFIITGICCATGFLLKMVIAKQQWVINPDLNALLILKLIWFNIKSVLFEELIFRGVLLYILIKKLGSTKAIIISAAGFGVYHWFSHELFGNIQAMELNLLLPVRWVLCWHTLTVKPIHFIYQSLFTWAGVLYSRLFFPTARLAINFLLR